MPCASICRTLASTSKIWRERVAVPLWMDEPFLLPPLHSDVVERPADACVGGERGQDEMVRFR